MAVEHNVISTNLIHAIPGLGPAANLAARVALTPTPADIAKVTIQSDTQALWALRKDSPLRWDKVCGPIPINVVSGTAYTLALTDADGIIQCTSGSAVVLTFPLSSSLPGLTAGDSGMIIQDGAGAITLTPFSGAVHLDRRGGSLVSNGLYSEITWIYKGSDRWWITGDTV